MLIEFGDTAHLQLKGVSFCQCVMCVLIVSPEFYMQLQMHAAVSTAVHVVDLFYPRV